MLVATVVSACGGGGGGGSGSEDRDGSNASPPPPPAPAEVLAPISLQNSQESVATILDGVDHAIAAVEVSRLTLDVVQSRKSQLLVCGVGSAYEVTATLIDVDGNGRLSAGDRIVSESMICDGSNHDQTLDISAVDANGNPSGTVSFESSKDGVVVVTGQSGFAIDRSGETTALNIRNLSFSFFDGLSNHQFAEIAVDKDVYANSLYEIDFSGRIDSEALGGRIRFETRETLSGQQEAFPLHGEIKLTGEASQVFLRSRRGADTSEFAFDSVTESDRQTISWRDWMTGYMFGIQHAQIVITTSLQILPFYPKTTDQLRANFVIIDFPFVVRDGTYEWRRNGAVIPGETDFQLAASHTAKGDLIEVTARASSGGIDVVLTAANRIINSPPEIENVFITPAVAYTTDVLHFDPSISDPDNEPFQVSFAWIKDGGAIPGATGSALPASQHRRDDIVTASVTVDDGTDTVTAEATITIQDSPPRVSAISPPATASVGDTIGFGTQLYDPDGDPTDDVTLKIAYGPGNMQIDQGTGTVTWNVDLPMFSDVVDVNWGLAVDQPGGTIGGGTLRVANPGHEYVMLRTGLQTPGTSDGASVGDFDNDGNTEILLLADTLYELRFDESSASYRQTWAYPFAVDRQWAFTSGDTDGDGRHEIFYSGGDRLLKLDGVNRREVASISLDEHCDDLELADLNADGIANEIVCSFLVVSGVDILGFSYLILDASDLTEIYRTDPIGNDPLFELGNIDNDPALEIVSRGGRVVDGATYVSSLQYPATLGAAVAVGDVDGDGVAEVFCECNGTLYGYRQGTQFWDAIDPIEDLAIGDIDGDGDTEVMGMRGVTLRVYDFSTGAPVLVHEIGDMLFGAAATVTGDLDQDGALEIASFANAFFGKIKVADVSSGLIEWTGNAPDALHGRFSGGNIIRNTPVFIGFGRAQVSDTRLVTLDPAEGRTSLSANFPGSIGFRTMTPADVDSDGVDDVVVSVNGEIYSYDFSDGTITWLRFASAGVDVAAADFDNDGRDEVIAAGPGGAEVFDVFSGATLWNVGSLGSGTNLVAADITGDGNSEILLTAGPRIFVYEEFEPGRFEETLSVPLDIGESAQDLEVGDIDGDGDSEIVAWTKHDTFYHRIRVFDSSLNLIGGFELAGEPTDIRIEDSQNPRRNLLIAMIEEGSQVIEDSTVLISADPLSGGEVWRSPPLLGTTSIDSVHFLERPGGGPPRIVLGTVDGMFLTN